MKQTVYKLYWNFEKEEKWLNEMSAKGLALTDYAFGRYSFEETKPNKYLYRIELLKEMPRNPESQAYLRFLEEMDIECVATWVRWVFLRKKTEDGPFDLYSDIDCKIRYYRNILALWDTAMWINIIAALINIFAVVIPFLTHSSHVNTVNPYLVVLSSSIAAGFWCMSRGVRNKIKLLKKEKILKE